MTAKPNDPDELLETVDSEGRPTGLAKRSEVHGNPALIHRVVHVLVFNSTGALILQKRSRSKDVARGKWDTSVGGHVNPGEDVAGAAQREMAEELGISPAEVRFLYTYLFSNAVESELVSTYSCVWDAAVNFDRSEIEEVRYWTPEEIRAAIGTGVLSGHFEKEISEYFRFKAGQKI